MKLIEKGGYCNNPPLEVWPDYTGTIRFDQDATTNPQLANPRLFAECLIRCWCSNFRGRPALETSGVRSNTQPKFITPGPFSTQYYFYIGYRYPLQPSSQTYQITIDDPKDYSVPLSRLRGTYGPLAVENIQIYGDLMEVWGQPGLQNPPIYVSVDESNHIECNGPLPAWPLPPPWTIAEFNQHSMHLPDGALTGLCAVYQSGGYR